MMSRDITLPEKSPAVLLRDLHVEFICAFDKRPPSDLIVSVVFKSFFFKLNFSPGLDDGGVAHEWSVLEYHCP